MAQRHHGVEPKKSDASNEVRTSSSSNKNPTPLDFERFVPWLMLEMQSCVTVSVKRVDVDRGHHEEEAPKVPVKRLSKLNQVKSGDPINDSSLKSVFNKVLDPEPHESIRIKAFYDNRGHLAEIDFVDQPLAIHRQVLKVIALCVPFHKTLTKLTIRRTDLDCGIIYEISKLLPFSNLTDICLDHCHVLQENFYILLDQYTTLKHLSLSDCNIGDRACKEIAERIEDIRPASKNLRVLSLSWNKITDIGAEALGRSLRTNRRLLHLNLCNNCITRVGAAHILLPLSEFPLFHDEIIESSHKRLQYFAKKLEDDERCLKEITINGDANVSRTHQSRHVGHSKSIHYKKKHSREGSMESKSKSELDVVHEADNVGQCNDAFHPSNMLLKDGSWFSIGNLVLCSLNLAYNNLDYSFVEKLVNVLSYQNYHRRNNTRTGLLRVVIEGNDLPEYCIDYDLINMYLNQNVKDVMPYTSMKKRTGIFRRRTTAESKIFH